MKVLFISPTPTQPADAGNRLHIKSLVSFFKEKNYEVDYLLLAYENYDEQKMRAFLDNNLIIIQRDCIYQNKKTLLYILWKTLRRINKTKRRIQLLFGQISHDQFLYNSEVDNYFSVFAGIKIKNIAKTRRYDIVVCEYASMSKSLTYFGKEVFKILDTHDVFTDRFKIFLKNGMRPYWISLFKDQESKAVKRADLLLAVKEIDKEYLTTLGSVDVAIFNFIPEVVIMPKRIFEKKLLYLASGNKINIDSICYFIEKVFPLLLDTDKDTTLIIGGNICEYLEINNKNVVLHGKVNDIKDFYSLGDIVINPEKDGTGYKVKAIEALALGMPMVSTSAGAAGVTEPYENHLLLGNKDEDFVKAIKKLFDEPTLRNTLSMNGSNWVKNYKARVNNNLSEILASHMKTLLNTANEFNK